MTKLTPLIIALIVISVIVALTIIIVPSVLLTSSNNSTPDSSNTVPTDPIDIDRQGYLVSGSFCIAQSPTFNDSKTNATTASQWPQTVNCIGGTTSSTPGVVFTWLYNTDTAHNGNKPQKWSYSKNDNRISLDGSTPKQFLTYTPSYFVKLAVDSDTDRPNQLVGFNSDGTFYFKAAKAANSINTTVYGLKPNPDIYKTPRPYGNNLDKTFFRLLVPSDAATLISPALEAAEYTTGFKFLDSETLPSV